MTDHPLPNRDNAPDWEALARHLAGEDAGNERRSIEQAIEADPQRAALLKQLASAIAVPQPAAPTAAEVEAALSTVMSRRGAPVVPIQSPRVASLQEYQVRRPAWALRAAAAVVLVAGAGMMWRARSGTTSAPVAAREFASQVGVLDSVTLSDGTRVLLGPGSRIALSAGYGASSREVTLVGEARFDVHHDAARPFAVHAGSATFRDVGTVFTVHADASEGARVAVSEGAVAVQGDASGFIRDAAQG